MHFLQFLLGVWTLSILVNFVVSDNRIVGGFEAEDGQFPYQVSLRFRKQFHFCGGSILDEHWILTAAHCIDGQKHEDITVVTGSNSLSQGGDHYELESMVEHSDYVASALVISNDIALLKLKSPIAFGPKVQPIGLPTKDTSAGTNLTLSGWGMTTYPATKNNSFVPDKLQFAYLESISLLRCIGAQIIIPAIIRRSNLCTFTQEGQGACKGDSGGPLVHENHQVGVVSWGVPCAKGKPDVFTKVYSFLPWINKYIKGKEPTTLTTTESAAAATELVTESPLQSPTTPTGP